MNINIEKLLNGSVPSLPNSLDYSTLSKFLICPRYYFFRYIMGVIPISNEGRFSIDLVFGSSWHKGLEEGYNALKQGVAKPKELTDLSVSAFNEEWDEKVPNEADLEKCYPKVPGVAEDLLDRYWLQYEDFHYKIKIVQAEEQFCLPIADTLPLIHGTIDLIYYDPMNLLTVMEHKTTKSASQIWMDNFDNSFQVDMYATATCIKYDTVPMVMINAALVQKRSQDLFRIMLSKGKGNTSRFFAELQHNMSNLRNETNLLLKESKDGRDFQTAFPRCQHACMMYGRKCPYFDVCSSIVAPYKMEYLGFNYDVYDIEKLNGDKGGDCYSSQG